MRIVTTVVVFACLLVSCGVSMLVVTRDAMIRTPDGELLRVVVELRSDSGALGTEETEPLVVLGTAFLGILVEPLDMVVSTILGVDAVFRDDARVEGGPIGWLASLTPFATLTPPVYPSLFELSRDRAYDVSAEQLSLLRSPDPMVRAATAREVFTDRVLRFEFPPATRRHHCSVARSFRQR